MNHPSNELLITAHGIPAPQGSATGYPIRRANGSIGVAITNANKRTKPWRATVTAAAEAAAKEAGWQTAERGTPITLDITFALPRPKNHYGTGRNAGTLKPSAPHHHTVKPDGDKLLRAIKDALTDAKIYADDSQVTESHPKKIYADDTPPRATIIVRKLTDTPPRK